MNLLKKKINLLKKENKIEKNFLNNLTIEVKPDKTVYIFTRDDPIFFPKDYYKNAAKYYWPSNYKNEAYCIMEIKETVDNIISQIIVNIENIQDLKKIENEINCYFRNYQSENSRHESRFGDSTSFLNISSKSKIRSLIENNINKLNKKYKRDNYLDGVRTNFLSLALDHNKIEDITEAKKLFRILKTSHKQVTPENNKAFIFFNTYLKHEEIKYSRQVSGSEQVFSSGQAPNVKQESNFGQAHSFVQTFKFVQESRNRQVSISQKNYEKCTDFIEGDIVQDVIDSVVGEIKKKNEDGTYNVYYEKYGLKSFITLYKIKKFNVGDTVLYVKGDTKEKVKIKNIFLDEIPYYDIEFKSNLKQTDIEFLFTIKDEDY